MTSLYRHFHMRMECQDIVREEILEIEQLKDDMARLLQLADANSEFYLRELQKRTANSDPATNSAICLLAPLFFDYVSRSFGKLSVKSRMRVYTIIFNIADVLCIPDHVLLILERVESPKEARALIDIYKEEEEPSGVDFALAYAEFVQYDSQAMKVLSEGVEALISALYTKYDVTDVFITFLPYLNKFSGEFLISDRLLNRDLLLERLTPSLMCNAYGMKICYFYDIEPSTEILRQMLRSPNSKAVKYAFLIVCQCNIDELENEAEEALQGLLKDYRVSKLNKVELLTAGRESNLVGMSAFVDEL